MPGSLSDKELAWRLHLELNPSAAPNLRPRSQPVKEPGEERAVRLLPIEACARDAQACSAHESHEDFSSASSASSLPRSSLGRSGSQEEASSGASRAPESVSLPALGEAAPLLAASPQIASPPPSPASPRIALPAPAAPRPLPGSARAARVPKLPMVRLDDGAWYRARLLQEAGDEILVSVTGFEGRLPPLKLSRRSDRIWRGSYRGKDWRHLGGGAWEPKVGERGLKKRWARREEPEGVDARMGSIDAFPKKRGRPANPRTPTACDAKVSVQTADQTPSCEPWPASPGALLGLESRLSLALSSKSSSDLFIPGVHAFQSWTPPAPQPSLRSLGRSRKRVGRAGAPGAASPASDAALGASQPLQTRPIELWRGAFAASAFASSPGAQARTPLPPFLDPGLSQSLSHSLSACFSRTLSSPVTVPRPVRAASLVLSPSAALSWPRSILSSPAELFSGARAGEELQQPPVPLFR